jgi:hypothetical protein
MSQMCQLVGHLSVGQILHTLSHGAGVTSLCRYSGKGLKTSSAGLEGLRRNFPWKRREEAGAQPLCLQPAPSVLSPQSLHVRPLRRDKQAGQGMVPSP